MSESEPTAPPWARFPDKRIHAVKMYKAIVAPRGIMIPDENGASVMRMEVTFTIGEWCGDEPEDVMEGIMAREGLAGADYTYSYLEVPGRRRQ